jgi:hypothetical protein
MLKNRPGLVAMLQRVPTSRVNQKGVNGFVDILDSELSSVEAAAIAAAGADDAQAETIAAATILSILSKGQDNNSVVIQNTATANINYSTTFSLVIGAATYSLYIVLERLF